ncbi:MAG: recombination mediator RecR [Patescibacteria group bacterium]
MKYPKAIQNLIEKLSTLPSVGPKTAERYVFYLLKQNQEKLQNLAKAISELKEGVTICQKCLMISETETCAICQDQNRRHDILCIVSNTQDLLNVESTRQYEGKYFVLGNLINTIEDIGPDNLPIEQLIKIIKENKVQEVIIALNFTLEGETTALYLNKILKDHLKITRLAKGLPAGSDLEYADELTLGSALKYRNEIK